MRCTPPLGITNQREPKQPNRLTPDLTSPLANKVVGNKSLTTSEKASSEFQEMPGERHAPNGMQRSESGLRASISRKLGSISSFSFNKRKDDPPGQQVSPDEPDPEAPPSSWLDRFRHKRGGSSSNENAFGTNFTSNGAPAAPRASQKRHGTGLSSSGDQDAPTSGIKQGSTPSAATGKDGAKQRGDHIAHGATSLPKIAAVPDNAGSPNDEKAGGQSRPTFLPSLSQASAPTKEERKGRSVGS